MLKKDFFRGWGGGQRYILRFRPLHRDRSIHACIELTRITIDMATDIGIWTTDDYKMIVTKQLHANYKISPVLQI